MQGMDNQSDGRALFERGLAAGEKLLWTGRPVGRRVEAGDLTCLIPFLLLGGAFVCFSLMFFSGPGEAGGQLGFMVYIGPSIFILFGVVTIALGLGGVLKCRRRVRSRRYAITDRRVIIASTRSGFTTESVPLERIPRITSRIGANGVGTIALAEADKNFFWCKRYWPEASEEPFDLGIKYLYEIPNAEYVEGLLKNYVGRNEAEPAPDAASAANSVAGYELDAPYVSHPPRSVQPLLALITVFCNGLFQFGILWLGVSLIFFRGMYPGCDYFAPISHLSPVETASGVVTGLHVTGYDGKVEKKYTYEYRDSNGTMHEALYVSEGGTYTVGEKVTIEYSRWYPGISRIAGLEPGSPFIMLVFISLFPLVGALLVLFAIIMSVRFLGLLRNGEGAVGVLHSKKLSRNSDDSCYWYVVYHFKAIDGSEHQAPTRTRGRYVHYGNEEAEMKSDIPPRVFLLYISSNPENNITIDQLPCRPKFDRPGTVYSGRPWILLPYLIIPALFLFIHAFWYYASRR